MKIKKKRKKIIAETTVPISPEKIIEQTTKKPSRKVMIKGEAKNRSRKRQDIKKRKLLIMDSESTENI